MQTLRDYSLFVAGATVTAGWFVVHHHWFLDVWLAGWSLHALCLVIIVAMGVGALLPGLVATKAPNALASALAIAQVRRSRLAPGSPMPVTPGQWQALRSQEPQHNACVLNVNPAKSHYNIICSHQAQICPCNGCVFVMNKLSSKVTVRLVTDLSL